MRSPRSLSFALLLFAVIVVVPAESQKRTTQRPSQPSSAQAQDRERIAMLQNSVIAASMGFNVNAMLDLWTEDAVLLPPRHDPVVGKAALRRFFEDKKNQYANFDMLAYDEQWNEVMVIGEYAYEWGTVSYRMKPPTGSEFGAAVHAMRILKREEDGYWRVARAIWNE